MRTTHRVVATFAMLLICSTSRPANAARYEDRPLAARGFYAGVAAVANVVPIVSTLVAPRCLPGYVLCKLSFAAVSTLAVLDQLVFTGGSDLAQTRAILHRGFRGDWYLTGRHVAGDVTPQPLPDPPPAAQDPGEWIPPPL